MRFPAGLSARLARHRVLRTFSRGFAPAIFHLSPLVKHFPLGVRLENLSPETEWHSPAACGQAAAQIGAPIVWVGGTEPLLHPAIGEVAATLVEKGHYVFLLTSGSGLRKRIHEFKPVSRLYLCFEVAEDGPSALAAEDDERVCFETVAEAIRVARLSGFHTSVHCSVSETTESLALAARIASLQTRRVEGIIVSSKGTFPTASRSAKLLAAATQLIPARGWRSFSRLLEASYQQHASVSRDLAGRQSREASACEESA
jgi:prophage DNA circulation protein